MRHLMTEQQERERHNARAIYHLRGLAAARDYLLACDPAWQDRALLDYLGIAAEPVITLYKGRDYQAQEYHGATTIGAVLGGETILQEGRHNRGWPRE